MIEVTEKAVEMIKQYLRNQTGPGVLRILYQEKVGQKRPFLQMFFVEPEENDVIITEQGITFAVDKKLLDLAKPIRIDYAEIDEDTAGFQILSSLPMVGWKTW
jgi:Fe-S cluster assembly iron-binding protein IscA